LRIVKANGSNLSSSCLSLLYSNVYRHNYRFCIDRVLWDYRVETICCCYCWLPSNLWRRIAGRISWWEVLWSYLFWQVDRPSGLSFVVLGSSLTFSVFLFFFKGTGLILIIKNTCNTLRLGKVLSLLKNRRCLKLSETATLG